MAVVWTVISDQMYVNGFETRLKWLEIMYVNGFNKIER